MRHVIVAPLAAAAILAACTPNPGGTPSASASPGGGSPKPAASGTAKPATSGSSAPAAAGAGTMALKMNGEAVDLKGTTSALIERNNGMLTFSRASQDGPFDPENPPSLTTVRLIFEKTKGIKPFVLPDVKNDQERRCEIDFSGRIAYSSMTVSKDVSDTFAYKDGRVTGTWVFQAPIAAPTAKLNDFELTVDVEVPASLR